MKFIFDAHQDYQHDAINSVVDIFDGQPLSKGAFEVHLGGDSFMSVVHNEFGVGNKLVIGQDQILENVKMIQGSTLQESDFPENDVLDGMNFTVEMETGTGKTYVYLRTIYELNKKYGFKKFIIVVPSVAIREGVLKSIELMQSHFASLYGNIPLNSWVYDSKEHTRLRHFSGNNQLQVLIINIDSFNKKTNNIIHQEREGRKPIEFIQATNPFVIVDEPQNMETDKAKDAIASLNPLATFRYSATHRNLYNLMYKLDPVKAYDLRLVKRIEVDSVLEDENFNQPYIQVKSIKATKTKITAKLEIDVKGASGPTRKIVSVSKRGEDLFKLSKNRENYRDFKVDTIDAGSNYISFSNGINLDLGETHGGQSEDIKKAQIHQTILKHFEKELHILKNQPVGQRLKVLSLFFIDRVANYVSEDGNIRKWFINSYNELSSKSRYKKLKLPPIKDVHNGYFAKDKKGKVKDTREKTKSKDDDLAYQLIMKDKDRLLNLEEPLRFIFSHSALREGWDNPNVFQICTLNETKSEFKKRQEIGRGLRLAVMESGERCRDEKINTLTIIANESYEDFATSLQNEIEEDCGVSFENRIKNARKDPRTLKLKKGWNLDENFLELWKRIKHKTRYRVEYDSIDLIKDAAKEISKIEINKSVINVESHMTDMSYEEGVTGTMTSLKGKDISAVSNSIPDVIGFIQGATELTRKTIAEILIQSGKVNEISINPQQFLDKATKCLKDTLNKTIIDGIKYEKIAGEHYEMMLFDEVELDGYIQNIQKVDRSIYDGVIFDSDVEQNFAKELDDREDIKLFIKLPYWFKIKTPVGEYNPDWAIVKQAVGEEKKLYMVRETKGTSDIEKLRPEEQQKIKCGHSHFEVLDGVDFKHVSSSKEI